MTRSDMSVSFLKSMSIIIYLYFLSICLPLVLVFPTRTMLLHQELSKNNLK